MSPSEKYWSVVGYQVMVAEMSKTVLVYDVSGRRCGALKDKWGNTAGMVVWWRHCDHIWLFLQ